MGLISGGFFRRSLTKAARCPLLIRFTATYMAPFRTAFRAEGPCSNEAVIRSGACFRQRPIPTRYAGQASIHFLDRLPPPDCSSGGALDLGETLTVCFDGYSISCPESLTGMSKPLMHRRFHKSSVGSRTRFTARA